MPNDDTNTRGPSKVWDTIEDELLRVAQREGESATLSRVIVLGELTTAGGKRLIMISSDAAGLQLKPWEKKGILMGGLVDSAP